ncbi:hypothetical protein JCM3774_003543 [Rhodotorula dairenensis]
MAHIPVCRHYASPGGCRYGTTCKFRHSAGPPAASGGRFATNQRQAPTASSNSRPLSQAEYLAGVPRGTCRSFWHEGRCKFGTACRHKHDQSKADSPSIVRRFQPTSRPAPAPLSDQDLTAIASGASSDAVAPRPAYFARGQLYRYLARDGSGRFVNGSHDMYAFVEALWASTKETPSWSLEDASNVILGLKALSPGLARIAEVVAADISPKAGSSSRLLSFQRGFYLTSSVVKNSVVVANVNGLFAILLNNPSWARKTHDSLRELVAQRSVSDPNTPTSAVVSTNFLAIFGVLGQLLLELMRRFPDAVVAVPDLDELVQVTTALFDEYSRDILSESPTCVDEPILAHDIARRRFVLEGIKRTLETMTKVLERAQVRPITDALPRELVGTSIPAGVLAMLRALMQPPGELRADGPRHDNDFANIRQIAIMPTPRELTSSADAFIPADLSDAPYHLEGMEGRLDILFRLMREDFVGPLRAAIQSLLVDFEHLDDKHNSLAALLSRGGGRYRPSSSIRGGDSSDLMVYRDVEIVGIELDRHELLLNLRLTLPAGFKSTKHIVRNLAQGNLVALLSFRTTAGGSVRNVREVEIDLGVVATDLKGAGLSVNFFDGGRRSIYLDAVRQFADEKRNSHRSSASSSELYLIELPGFLVATVQPFLRALQQLSAPAIPFADILSAKPPARGQKLSIQPPLYARNPGFEYDLSSILIGEDVAPRSLVLHPTDPESVQDVRDTLAQPGQTRLDPTQAQALVDCLTREVALVEGPPGTGKSFLGVELVRVLLAANVGKILILAFTNHALDDMLKHVYDQVTKDVVRCGSRSEDETLQAVSLFSLLGFRQPQLRGARGYEIGQKLKQRHDIEQKIKRLCAVAQRPASQITWQHLAVHLQLEGSPLVHAFTSGVPHAVEEAIDAQDGWYTVGKRAGRVQRPEGADDVFSFWRNGADLDVRQRYVDLQAAERVEMRHHRDQATAVKADAPFTNSFAALALDDADEDSDACDAKVVTGQLANPTWTPIDAHLESDADYNDNDDGDEDDWWQEAQQEEDWSDPSTDRPICDLLVDTDVWSFSRTERARTIEHYTAAIVADEAPELHGLRRKLEQVNNEIHAFNSEEKLTLLNRARVIGATTNGCANVLELIEKVRPTVVLIEEAGECLESQIVANLVPSVQHLICIGDHLQLRPHITSYSLSIDSARGKIHRHDVSLFERLAVLPIAMSVLETQRRMRPEISKLIRNALYPQLEDAPNVLEYPDVQGMSRNVFFVDHRFQQDDASAHHSSHTNSAEAHWVVDLVRHLALQGTGASICILTPYLGQLRILRSLLEAVKITTVLDERDLGDLEAEDDAEEGGPEVESRPQIILQPQARQQSLNTQVLLRTVDRFQGEEADIVVLSLVRNSRTRSDGAEDGDEQAVFSRDVRASIGFLKSPNRTNVAVSRAKHGMYLFGNAALLRSQAPIWESIVHNLEEGGNVGPTLPATCVGHPEKLLRVDGPEQLPRLAPFGGESHPKCKFSISQVQLPCGHVQEGVKCWRAQHPAELNCAEKVQKELPCGHVALLTCGADPLSHLCAELCGATLSCAHKFCRGRCSDCKALQRQGDAFGHVKHPHEKVKACGHVCKGSCFDHVLTKTCDARCTDWCSRACSHGTCKKPEQQHRCSEPCPSCLQQCDTPGCALPCASPCNVVPKDVACTKKLPKCGCPCPSLKNEPCDRQVCPKHSGKKDQVVDLVMMTTLAEFDPSDLDPLQKLVTLDCGHAFTAETLDGSFELTRFFAKRNDGPSWGAPIVPLKSVGQLSCPTCKQVVSSASNVRYRRAIKFAEVHNQEQLARLEEAVDAALADDKVTRQIERLRPPKNVGGRPSSDVVASARYYFMVHTAYARSNTFVDAGLSGLGSFGKRFYNLVHPLLRLHVDIDALVLERSPHTVAYDAGLGGLFRAEKLAAANENRPLSDEQALRIARVQICMAPQTSDNAFALRSAWLAMEVRYRLSDICYKLASRLKSESEAHAKLAGALCSFGAFILETVERDLARCRHFANANESKRLQLESALNELKCSFKIIQYRLRHEVERGEMSREQALESSASQRDQRFTAFNSTKSSLLSSADLPASLLDWTRTAIMPNVDRIRDQWLEFEKSLQGPFKQEVTDAERRMVVQVFQFSTTGHWYTCERGHPYVIGDCGGAMEVATCPECGGRIGGRSHTLDATNRNATDLDDLAVEAGARREYAWRVHQDLYTVSLLLPSSQPSPQS